MLVEAEKSALALTAWADRQALNLVALATGGCWGWSQNKAPLSDLDVCKGRQVTILFDANTATNANVQKARSALTLALQRMGCNVRIADMPLVDGVNGPDDLIAMELGDSLLAGVFNTARPAVVAEYSEDALAARFAEQYRDTVRYVAAWDRWFVWNDKRWAPDEIQTVPRLVQQMCEEVARRCPTGATANRVRSRSTRLAVQREASVDGRLAATADQWDTKPWLLNVPSGTLDLNTGQLRQARREDYLTKLASAAPERKRPTLWLEHLKFVTGGNRDLQAYLHRVCGYCLTGDVSEEVFFFLYGTGKNGKSVFVETIRDILGDYAQVTSMDTFTATHNPTHPTDLAKLRGARLATATETEEGHRWAEAKLKQLTGGDRITARFMHQNFFEYLPQFKLMISGNHKPKLRNVDEAMRRRIHLIPFEVTIPPDKRIRGFAKKLRAEWGAILQWAVEGCVVWQREGLKPPPAVIDATNGYLEAQDVLADWITERAVVDKNVRANPTELYRDFAGWAQERNQYIWPQKQFSQKLEEYGYLGQKSHGQRYIIGLGLRHQSAGGREGSVVPINHTRGELNKGVAREVIRQPRPLAPPDAVGHSRKFT